ncbi:MAG: CHASE3 domain-containing protein [Candidatus Acidiferrales bacterium]
MEQRHTPRLIFTSALVLLLLSGLFSGWAIYRLYQGDQWLHHTYDVELTLASIESDLSAAGRSRTKFFESSDTQYLEAIAQARTETFADLARVRALVADNRDQLARSYRLESAINGRLAAVEKGIELAKNRPTDKVAQDDLTALLTEWAIQTSAISDEMNRAEDILLEQRSRITGRRFVLIAAALAFMFLLAVILIWEHYRRLAGELKRRVLAEQNARNLSTQVLRVQDDERRRISRELHDGLGQNLIAAKMIADSFLTKPPTQEVITQLNSILEGTVSSVRSMSYLLHPPLLDEIGLTSAAEWLIDGLSKRSDILVKLEIGGTKRRLPPGVEVALFRILQESLANIQRHARASKADIFLNFEADRVLLRICDHGVGISAEKLRELEERASYAGIGLAGMKQRAQEQGGTFRLSSSSNGTTIEVEVPTAPETQMVEGISA